MVAQWWGGCGYRQGWLHEGRDLCEGECDGVGDGFLLITKIHIYFFLIQLLKDGKGGILGVGFGLPQNSSQFIIVF